LKPPGSEPLENHLTLSMDDSLFLRGLVIGFSIAAPVGPIGVLCIRRTLADGQMYGLISGLGAATADALYGCVAAFGLTIISSFLIGQKIWFSLIGGLFLLYLGIKTLLSKPAEQAVKAGGNGLLGAYTSTFLLTLTNPMTILAFAAIFAALGLGNTSGSYTSALILVLGVFCGSALWWLLLSGGVGLFRDKFNAKGLLWVNRISGVIITAFGIVALGGLI
jgi:threonine/homoserine/homoserine lactone efflux protein